MSLSSMIMNKAASMAGVEKQPGSVVEKKVKNAKKGSIAGYVVRQTEKEGKFGVEKSVLVVVSPDMNSHEVGELVRVSDGKIKVSAKKMEDKTVRVEDSIMPMDFIWVRTYSKFDDVYEPFEAVSLVNFDGTKGNTKSFYQCSFVKKMDSKMDMKKYMLENPIEIDDVKEFQRVILPIDDLPEEDKLGDSGMFGMLTMKYFESTYNQEEVYASGTLTTTSWKDKVPTAVEDVKMNSMRVNFYKSALSTFHMCDPETWKNSGGRCFEKFRGFLILTIKNDGEKMTATAEAMVHSDEIGFFKSLGDVITKDEAGEILKDALNDGCSGKHSGHIVNCNESVTDLRPVMNHSDVEFIKMDEMVFAVSQKGFHRRMKRRYEETVSEPVSEPMTR